MQNVYLLLCRDASGDRQAEAPPVLWCRVYTSLPAAQRLANEYQEGRARHAVWRSLQPHRWALDLGSRVYEVEELALER